MRVLITDGHSRAALAVTRSLGRLGHEVLVGDSHPSSLAHWSRHCSMRIVYPDPVTESDEFVDYLADIVRDFKVEILVPIVDVTTLLVTRHRDRFEPLCAIPFGEADVIERAADKVDIVRTAQRIGVPVPRSVIVEHGGDMPDLDLGYPVVIKPGRSRVRTPQGWRSAGVSLAGSIEELARDLSSRPQYEFPVILQERIVGSGAGVFACYHHGRPVALFGHRRLRERPPWGGVSVLSESVALCPLSQDSATRLLDELGWYGVAMVEFKHDVRDGVPKLMEINGRFWGSLQLAIDAGVDFPALLLRGLQSASIDIQPPYRIGVRSRWFWGDVDSLILALLAGSRFPNGLRAHRVRRLLEFCKIVGRDLHYDNPKLDDLAPWLLESYQWCRRSARDLLRLEQIPADAQFRSRIVSRRRAQANLHTRITSTLEDSGLDESGWNALVAKSQTRTVFQTQQWMRAWLSVFGTDQEPVFVTVFDTSGALGVAPLAMRRPQWGRATLHFLGEERADYCDVLDFDRKPDVIAAVAEALLNLPDWGMIELTKLPGASTTPELLRAALNQAGCYTLIDNQYKCPTLLILGHEASALAILNGYSLRRRRRYFERTGRLVFRDLSRAGDIEPYLETFFAQHITRWATSKTQSLFVDPRNREFYRRLTKAAGPSGWLLFSVAEFDGRPIAFHYGFDFDGAVLWYKPSFDVSYADWSPGTVMVEHLIRYAIEHGRRELDFTLGDEPYKQRFSNSVRNTVHMKIFRDRGHYITARSRSVLTDVLAGYRRNP